MNPIVSDAEKQEKVLNALQAVLDPEIGLSVIDLDLIREVVFTPEEGEVKMVLTTPFCPYAGAMIAQIKEEVENVVGHEAKITLLAERWDPRDAGLMW